MNEKFLLTISATINLLLITIILNRSFFINLVKNINNNIDNIFIIDNYNNIFMSRYILLFLFILWIGICFDNRFSYNRKILIPIYYIILILFLIIFKHNSFIWKEIFWYSFICNISFIFHVCICDWLYRLSIYYKQEYLSYVVTRISFIFSLSFIIYLLHIVYIYLNDKYNKKFHCLFEFINILINSSLLILIYFVDWFTNYSLLLMGRNNNKVTFKVIIKNIIFVLWTFIISYYLLGIIRIYFIWIYFFFIYIFKLIKNYGIKNIYSMLSSHLKADFSRKITYLINNYNRVNHKNFTYSFIEFIDYTTTISNPYLNYHIKCPFFYYTKKHKVLSFIRSYFIRDIIDIELNYITTDTYDFVITNIKENFNIDEAELIIYKEKLKKIYKSSILNGATKTQAVNINRPLEPPEME